jgi:hypothetical protein
MVRLDAVALALSLLAGAVAIEDSHRLDTGAPDEGLVAAAPGACSEDQMRAAIARERRVAFDGVVNVETGMTIGDAEDGPRLCAGQ